MKRIPFAGILHGPKPAPGERIRVLHCLAAVSSGGVERRRLALARLLDPSRYEQRLIARTAGGTMVAEFERLGVPVRIVGSGPLFEPRALGAAVREARAFRPHIVHGAVFEGVGLAVVTGRAVGARVAVEETSHATNRSWRGHALFRLLAAASDACVAISPAVGAYLQEVTRIPNRRITVITNGAVAPTLPPPDVTERLRIELGFPRDALVIGTVGRLMDDSHKRVVDLIHAMALIAPTHPHVRLLVIGDGSERPRLERLSAGLGLSNTVRFLGHWDDVGGAYAVMDVFALASAREGFGLAIAEAMLANLPVVATRVGGIRDIVVNDETGLLVPPLNPTALATALMRLCDDAPTRERMGRLGRERAERYFSIERYVRDVDSFYRALLAAG